MTVTSFVLRRTAYSTRSYLSDPVVKASELLPLTLMTSERQQSRHVPRPNIAKHPELIKLSDTASHCGNITRTAMGWIWSDTPPKANPKPAPVDSYDEAKNGATPRAAPGYTQGDENHEFAQTIGHQAGAESIPFASESKSAFSPQALTREQQAEADLEELLTAFDDTSSSSTTWHHFGDLDGKTLR